MEKSKKCKPIHLFHTSDEEILAQYVTSNESPTYKSEGYSGISRMWDVVDYYTLDDHGRVHEKFNSKVNFNTNFMDTKPSWENPGIAPPRECRAPGELDAAVASFLEFLGGLVLGAITFQLKTFTRFITFPIWLMYCSFMFVVDPFRILKWATGLFLRTWCGFCDTATLPLRGQQSLMKLAMKFCWGFFWAAYVCFLLVGLLGLGFVVGGVTMRHIVEEPIHMTETLNFDYTKTSPVALVPIISCPSISCGTNCKEKIDLEKLVGAQPLRPTQNLKLAISLNLPESDYNQKLGVFQVRVDHVSIDGEVTASPSYPCMLQFKSQLIRYVETFLRSLPLIAGYSSESQTVNIKMRSLTEENEPVSCLKVILEQRAEYRPGTGIPEIYSASLVVESELPVIKRVLWFWRKTVFVWISMASFMMELMLLLVCCRPVIVPRTRARSSSGKKIAHRNDIALIKDT